MHTISKEQLERLAFCRYLFQQAKFHLSKGSPLSSFTVLIIHDATEIFLQVALEIKCPQVKKTSSSILETMTQHLNVYLTEQKQTPISIALIKKINEVRNGLKHVTIFANTDVVSNLYSDVFSFFEAYLKIFFEANITDVSLVTLIQNEFVRSVMSDAEKHSQASNFAESMIAIGKAYHALVETEMVVRNSFGLNVIIRRIQSNYFQSKQRYLSLKDQETRNEFQRMSKDLDEYFNLINERIGNIEVASFLGIDFKSYTSFVHCLPDMHMMSQKDDKGYPVFFVGSPRAEYSAENVDFSFDFMIDICFRLQSIKTSGLPTKRQR